MEIVTKALRMVIGDKEILNDVNLQLNNKEFLGIIGPNGSGKTTFLKCVYRVQKPTSGQVLINGQLLDEMSFRESAMKLSVVAQHNFYSFDFDVLDVVMLGRSPHKSIFEHDNSLDYDIARQALSTVGLRGFEKRAFSTLSGGEQQRVILARALTQQTECMILDEPTNHLDVKYQLQIMDIVKSLNLTVIAAVHDLNMAANYCDRLIAFKAGKIFGSGRPCDLLTEHFIYELFEVETKVQLFPEGRMSIIYVPKHWQNGINENAFSGV